MHTRIGWFILGVAALAAYPVSPCTAQQVPPATLEFNAGFGFGGSSSPHGTSRGLSMNALAALRPGSTARTATGFLVAVSGSVNAIGSAEACDLVPGGSCTPEFPDFWILSALAGWETGNGRGRVLVGPAVARANEKTVGAAQARVDLAQPVIGHLSLLVSGQFDYIPKYQGDSFRLGSLGVGFRLR